MAHIVVLVVVVVVVVVVCENYHHDLNLSHFRKPLALRDIVQTDRRT
jgi:hypothetical protein